MSPKNKRQLRFFLINPRFQLKYIFWTSLTGALLVSLNSAIFYSYIRENYAILVDLSPMEEEAKQQLYRELRQIVFNLGLLNAAFLAVCALFGLILSHRTAGPMYHFKRVFREIQAGRLEQRIRLRPKDDFQDVAQECNAMLDSIIGKAK